MKKTARKVTSSAQALATRINTTLKSDVVGVASDPRFTIQRVSSGSLVIDRITGGGFPRGRHIELFGDYAAGKSYIAYLTMALAQARGELCAIIDAENVFDAAWFSFLGGDPGQLLSARPRTAEQLIEVLMLFADTEIAEENGSQVADIVTVDSVASLLPQEELNKAPTEGEDRTASRARMMSRALRRITTVNDNTLFLWTNQLIDQVGGYGGATTPGGRALKFYASTRVQLRREKRKKLPRKRAKESKLVSVDTPVGQWVIVRAEKQKVGRPELESMFLFDFERRIIDPEMEIIHLGLEDGLIERSHNTFSYTDSDDQEWTGQEAKFRRFLRDEEDLREELTWAINENSRAIAIDVEGGDDGEDD